ncbi:hypothetical protein B0H17DRAFT_1128367 [Mycena rosella]|uniref:Retroviral polymerase SH3-like domain-containing protein n=1 Tax=Mycena rosella TaxID=1033263 RepID=A0AAD7DZR6_MYCRO|nr:hypothetical protein B0H17DRAFT_1128367 [Mycena rosella]
MSRRFWAEAATAHCYVRGFIPSSRHPDVVPWVAWFRRKDDAGNLVKLNVSHLRVWGSDCWVKDLDEREGKLGEQSWKGKMVGYMGRRGYRIYDASRLRVFEVRNVIFEEAMPHRTRIPVVNNDEEPLPIDMTLFEDEAKDMLAPGTNSDEPRDAPDALNLAPPPQPAPIPAPQPTCIPAPIPAPQPTHRLGAEAF